MSDDSVIQSSKTSGETTSDRNNNPYDGLATPNPLGSLSSYTYGLSLYMVSPTAMNKFITGGGTMNITQEEGITVIAQSGGLSNNETSIMSIKGRKMDYYIDDLNLATYLPGGTNKATVSTEIKFKIIEPVGFAFLQDLNRAGVELNKKFNVNAENMTGFKQHFIIGINFFGYDVDGAIMNFAQSGKVSETPTRYFSIKFTKIKFKLDGKVVNYNCEAVILSEAIAIGNINATIKTVGEIKGNTVNEILTGNNGLTSYLNTLNQKLKDNGQVKIPIQYKIEFVTADGKKDNSIAEQLLIDDATYEANLARIDNIDSTTKSVATTTKAGKAGGGRHYRTFSMVQGQNVLTVIDNIISKSNYITSALTEIASATAETITTKNSTTRKLKWYTVKTIVETNGYDNKTNDWAYIIKYQIIPYEIPYIRNVYNGAVSTYPGPKKVYNYWLTGENSEIISYEQQYDNLYYVVASMSQNSVDNTKTNNVGTASVGVQSQDSADHQGSVNKNFMYNQNVVAQLYSPGDQARAKIKILGDPDYIMSLIGVNNTLQKTFNTKNGINPFGGQVFIQIKFGMATDYDDNGLLDVSGNIQFYGSDTVKNLKIEGVIYKVIKVDSTFSRGTFTQVLDCILVDQTLLITEASTQSANNQRNENYGNEGKNYSKPPNQPNKTKETSDRLKGFTPSTAGAGQGSRGIPNANTPKPSNQRGATAEEFKNRAISLLTNQGRNAPKTSNPNDDAIKNVTTAETYAAQKGINPNTLLPLNKSNPRIK